MNKRSYKYFIPVVLLAATYVWAAEGIKEEKKMLNAPLSPPTAQEQKVAVLPMRRVSADESFPAPYNLRVKTVQKKNVTLSWNNPEPMNGYFDDFESHPDFVINSAGPTGLSYLDLDQKTTYTLASSVYPNAGSRMAFQIFNPGQTTPEADNPNLKAYSGEKYLACFTVDGQNNDWVISPELSFTEDFQISFRAKTFHEKYGLERIRVGYSTTGKKPSDFKFISEGEFEEIPLEWTLKSYNIPANARYVTINCVSKEAFILMIDDLFIGTNIVRPKAASQVKLVGFNIYRDGVKVNESPVEDMSYVDQAPDYGLYHYEVKAAYSNGQESAFSNKVTADVKDVRLLPFVEHFDNWNLTDQEWELADGDESRWRIDYYEVGLVNPCATYRYSQLKDYSQALVSKELSTPDRSNLFLRMNVKMRNYSYAQTDYLAVEIADASDNYQSWQEVGTLDNSNESFDWTLFQFDLGNKLKSDLFKFRFRAHGSYAYNIDYWYVDDIKVWNPEWTSLEIETKNGGTLLSGVKFELKGEDGAVYSVMSDENGKIVLPKIEKGNYKVTGFREGYNSFNDEWEINGEGQNSRVALLTAPVIQLDKEKIEVSLSQEQQYQEKLAFRNVGDGPISWKLQNIHTPYSGDDTNRFTNQAGFRASGDLQSSIVFDGEFFYASSWYFLGTFYKYDRQGNFLEEFMVDDFYYKVYDFGYDGRYFYASNRTNVLYQLDLKNKKLVNQIVVKEEPNLQIRHCAYDPRNDQFWIGEAGTICRIDRTGKLRVALRELAPNTTLSIGGTAFDNVSPGGPYLWLSCENPTPGVPNQFDQVSLRQLKLSTLQLTTLNYSLTSLPGFMPGDGINGPTYAIGLEGSFELEPGAFSLVGILQQSPSLIYSMKICDLNNGILVEPVNGTLQAGETQELTISMDAVKSELGKSYTSALQFTGTPQITIPNLELSYNVTEKALYARPVKMVASSIDESGVKLSWEAGDGQNTPTGYQLYRNGVLLTEKVLTTPEFEDLNLLRGDYSYQAVALYDQNKSQYSEPAKVTVKAGIPCFAPLDVTSELKNNKEISLSWKSPETRFQESRKLQWGDGTSDEKLGLSAGGVFFVASKWQPEEINHYRGMEITHVSGFFHESIYQLNIQIRKDNEVVCNQVVNSKEILYGEYSTFKLATPVVIEAGSEYMIGFRIIHEPDYKPMGMDLGPAVREKGNLISEDGRNWMLATDLGATDGNFSIAFRIDPPAQPLPMPELLGYNLFRNGVKVNESPIQSTSYVDVPQQKGRQSYRLSSVYSIGESQKSDSTYQEIVNIAGYFAPTQPEGEVVHNGLVRLTWNYPTETEPSISRPLAEINPADLPEGYPEFISQWRVNGNAESGVASDGMFFYTSSWKTKGEFNKYTLKGEYLETFKINNAGAIRDLSYDGTYFYGGDTGNKIYKMDFAKRELVSTHSISEIARHCAFIPDLDNGKGGFEVGDWLSSIYVSLQGAKLGSGPVYKGAFGTAYHNGLIYAFEQGNSNKTTIGVFDFAGKKRIRNIDLEKYPELNLPEGGAAGGLSVFDTREGAVLLVACIQGSPLNQIVVLEVETVSGVMGYNLYCNGAKVNESPVATRYFEEYKSEEGTYNYQLETVYKDGGVSTVSNTVSLDILPKGTCNGVVEVKAFTSLSGYNAYLSFADPDLFAAPIYESGEGLTPNTLFSRAGWQNLDLLGNNTRLWPGYNFDGEGQPGAWRVFNANSMKPVMADYSFEGSQALYSMPGIEGESAHMLITPLISMDKEFEFSFSARNTNDTYGEGTLSILYSTSGNEVSDFIFYRAISTSEPWKRISYTLPKEVKYVAVQHSGSDGAPQMIDAIAVRPVQENSRIYGYDIYRDGVKLNEKVVEDVTYTDHNLLPETYEYQVKYYTTLGCISDLSSPVSLAVDYQLACEAPGTLLAVREGQDVLLSWTPPALGDAIRIGRHSGINDNAAGMPSGGSYFAGVMWKKAELSSFSSLYISEVEIYVQNPPDALFILIYENNEVVYQQFVPEVKQYSFNTIPLEVPHKIDESKDLKVVLYIEHNEISVPLGYDEGPGQHGLGDLYSSDGVNWSTLYDNEIDGNWNITVGLRSYPSLPKSNVAAANRTRVSFAPSIAPSQSEMLKGEKSRIQTHSTTNKFNGFHLYKNGERVTEQPVLTTSYRDETPAEGVNSYYVTSVFDQCGEIASNVATLSVVGIEEMANSGISVLVLRNSVVIKGTLSGDVVEITQGDGRRAYSAVSSGDALEVRGDELQGGVYVVTVLRANKVVCNHKVKI